MPIAPPQGMFPWYNPFNTAAWEAQRKEQEGVPVPNVLSQPKPLINPQGTETAPKPAPLPNALPVGQAPGGNEAWNAIYDNGLREWGSQQRGLAQEQPALGSPAPGPAPARGAAKVQPKPLGGFSGGAAPSPTVGGQVRSAVGPGGGTPQDTLARSARSSLTGTPQPGQLPSTSQPGSMVDPAERLAAEQQWKAWYDQRNADAIAWQQDQWNQERQRRDQEYLASRGATPQQIQQAASPYVSQYRVTSGSAQPSGGGWYSVDSSNLRAWTGQNAVSQGALDFVWNGLPAQTKPLESGDMREQIALRLGPNQMNEVSMAWRMPNSGGGIVVQLKYNPGISDPAPGQSNVTGYSTIRPTFYKAPPALQPGQTHQIQYALNGNQLSIFADGDLTWQGNLSSEALAIMQGELNVRADNWKGNFALAAGQSPQTSQPTQQTAPQTQQLSREWQQYLSNFGNDQYSGDRQGAAMMYQLQGPDALNAYGKWLLGMPGGSPPQGYQAPAQQGSSGGAIQNWGGWAWGNVPINSIAQAGFQSFEVGWSDSVTAEQVDYLKRSGVTPYAYINLGEQDPNLPTGYNGPILRQNGEWGTQLVDVTNASWQAFITRRVGEAYAKGITGIKFDVAEPDVPPGMTRQQVTESLANLLRSLKQRYSGLSIVLNQGFSLAIAHPELIDGIQTEGMFSGSNMQPWNTSGFWWKDQYDQLKYLQGLGIPIIIAEYADPTSRYGQQLQQAIEAQGFIPYITSSNWQTRGSTIGVNAGW